MDAIAGKVGSYWFNQKAKGELSSVGNDINSLQSSIEGGAKWLVNKVKGSVQKPLPELLKEYDLPSGLFPKDATNYEFNPETGKLVVNIPQVCEVGYRDQTVVRFSTTVTGQLGKGKLAEIEGMKTKVIIWVKLTMVWTDESKLYVSAGIKRTRSREAYEVIRNGICVDRF
ncbi:hypothetical protein HN51_022889 [Arachis hypogaea]|uniref:DUF538 family protein n=2 Tax=Arachis TaxID=3817 RepID=A0A445EAL4_ARAHY|nr:uncharacterized protein At5g01610 [Arachis duranensis]XP_025655753.1 uncharacterized protein At5g01610 [Arachis hypogaea]QHO54242.1 uncharacterized protein DS421_2g55010 [Arachis hypogaea]RYR72373.1 hypothetical protein Ahy_A02g006582 [Arachis hypogaea]